MNISDLSLTFQSTVALAILLVMWVVVRGEQRTDVFRQKMFAVRDELFDFARDGNIDFQDPAYQLLRNSMNGFIRYGHRLTFFRLALTIARWSVTQEPHPLTWHSKWDNALENLPSTTKDSLKGFHDRAMDVVARHLIGGSCLLMVFLGLLVIQSLINGAWTSLTSLVRDQSERAITCIFDPRVIEEEAIYASSGS